MLSWFVVEKKKPLQTLKPQLSFHLSQTQLDFLIPVSSPTL